MSARKRYRVRRNRRGITWEAFLEVRERCGCRWITEIVTVGAVSHADAMRAVQAHAERKAER